MVETQTEYYTGSDCTGSDGDSNRVLTLANTDKTVQDGFSVYVSGLELSLTSEYTVSHNSTATEITFLNALFDDMNIIVTYDQNIDVVGSGAKEGSDFTLGPLADFGVVATRTPVTMTTDFSGNKTYTDGTDEDINIVLQPYNKKYDLDKSGLNKTWDATAMIGPDDTLNKYDKITYDSKVYRVDSVSTRDFNGTTIFKKAMLFYIQDE